MKISYKIKRDVVIILFSTLVGSVILFSFAPHVFAESITVTAPSVNSPCLQAGSTYRITWIADFSPAHYAVYQTGDITTPPPLGSWISGAHPVTTTYFDWVVPNTPGTPVKIWVEAHDASHARLGIWSSSLVGIGSPCSDSGGGGTIPLAPSLVGSNPSGSLVNLNWVDHATNESDYKLYRRAGAATSWNLVATLSANAVSYSESSVPAGTHDYQVWACNSAGCSGSSIITITIVSTTTANTDTTPPSNPSSLIIQSTTSSSITIQWTAPGDDGNTGTVRGYEVNYSTTPPSGMTPDSWWAQSLPAANLIYNPAIFGAAGSTQNASISNLTPGTTYYLAVRAKDEIPNWSTPSSIIAGTAPANTTTNTTTAIDTTAPIMSNVRLENITGSGTQVLWATDDPSDSRVYYGTNSSSLTMVAAADCFGSSIVTSHCANLTGLTLGTQYYYRAESKNSAGLPGVSLIYTFTSASSTATTTSPTPIPSPTPSITLTPIPAERMAHIRGTIANPQGSGVANVSIWGRERSTEKFVQARTTVFGSYEFSIPPGTWEFNISTDMLLDYAYQGGTKTVIVQEGESRELLFTLRAVDSGISGTIRDTTGTPITDIHGYVSLVLLDTTTQSTPASVAGSFGGPLDQGKFAIKALPGNYGVRVYFPPDSKYAAPLNPSVTLSAGQIMAYTINVRSASGLITGAIQDTLGARVTEFNPEKIKIYASSEFGAWYNATISSTAGSYELMVPEGTWTIGFWIDQSTGYTAVSPDTQVAVSTAKPVRHNLLVARAGSTIKGAVTTEEGAALSNILVSLYSQSTKPGSGETIFQTSPYIASTSTDRAGAFAFSVPPGTYYLYTSSGSGSGYLSPDETKILVTSGETTTQNLVFKKPDITVRGTTRVGSKGVSAFIWAWGDAGGYVQTQSNTDGAYTVTLSKNTTWHLAASRESNEGFFRAAEIDVNTRALTPPPADLTMVSMGPRARAVEHTIEAARLQSIELSDGARIIVPANSLTASGTANISVKPTIEVPSIASSSVVGTSYTIEATTSAGTAITSLNTEITITIPYSENDLKARGLTPETLILSYFDETTSSWKPVDKQVVDKENRVVIGTVNHLTVFALIAPADTTPPPAPTNMSITRKGGKVTLTWENPSVDFNHIKIYRSTVRGTLGTLAYNYLVTASQDDAVEEPARYYTIRAIDLSGNESKNTTQLAVPAADTIPVPRLLTATLRHGARGPEVKLLQELLITMGYLKSAADGIFGRKTLEAVRGFQRAATLTADGIVGKNTRMRLLERAREEL